MNQQSFSNLTGISPATLSSIFNGRTKPTLPHLLAIQKCFPNINIQWLLNGEGVMFPPSGSSSQMDPHQVPLKQQSSPDSETDKMADGTLPFDEVDPVSTPVSNAHTVAAQRSNTGRSVNKVSPQQINGGYQQPGFQQQSYPNQPYSGYNVPQHGGNIQGMGVMASPQRKITEIHVFYDDQTYESFYPKK